MDKGREIFNCIIAGLGAGLTYIFGTWDTALIVLIVFIVLDYVTGLSKAIYNQNLDSSVGFKGLLKKAVIFIILILGVLLDRLINDGTWVFRTLICYFYVANEGISILENCAAMGLPVPDKIKEALEQLKKEDK